MSSPKVINNGGRPSSRNGRNQRGVVSWWVVLVVVLVVIDVIGSPHPIGSIRPLAGSGCQAPYKPAWIKGKIGVDTVSQNGILVLHHVTTVQTHHTQKGKRHERHQFHPLQTRTG